MRKADAFAAFEWTGKGDRYVLTAPLEWRVGARTSDWRLVVPAGFVFDISVPRVLTWIVSRHHRPWMIGSAIHDYLLAHGYDPLFAASEWARACRRMAEKDSRRRLVGPAFYAMCWWTARTRI